MDPQLIRFMQWEAGSLMTRVNNVARNIIPSGLHYLHSCRLAITFTFRSRFLSGKMVSSTLKMLFHNSKNKRGLKTLLNRGSLPYITNSLLRHSLRAKRGWQALSSKVGWVKLCYHIVIFRSPMLFRIKHLKDSRITLWIIFKSRVGAIDLCCYQYNL